MINAILGDNSKFKDDGLDKWAPVKIDLEFGGDEFEKLKKGYPDKGMDDRWHICYENDWLYFNRSWTGWCNFKVKFEKIGDKYISTEGFAAGDKEETDQAHNDFNVKLIKELIDIYLIKYER